MTRERIRWKAVIADWNEIESYNDDDPCIVCLTPRQAAALAGFMKVMYWNTRWQNLPTDFDLFTWVSGIERELLMCGCGAPTSAGLNNCLCQIADVLSNLVAAQVGPPPVIPPDNPSQNLPALEPVDFPSEQRLAAALCDMSKALVASIFSQIYDGQLEKCQTDNDPDWGAISANSANFLLAASAVAATISTAPVALTLLGAGFVASSVSGFDLIFDFNIIPDSGDCPPNQVPLDIQTAYGCQLWSAMQLDFNFDTFRRAFDTPNLTAQGLYNDLNPGVTPLPGQALDEATRAILSQFISNGDIYQGWINALNARVESLYSSTDLCSDCIDCANGTGVLVDTWNDARIVDIIPPPDAITDDGDYSWNSGTSVFIKFDKTYCFTRLRFTLIRGATVGTPTGVEFTIGGNSNTYIASTGGFGDNDENQSFENSPGGVINISPQGSGTMRLRINGTSGGEAEGFRLIELPAP